MSAPVYELLKRPDELFVVEHAHLRPRFVEDSVRIALATTLERYPELSDKDPIILGNEKVEVTLRVEIVDVAPPKLEVTPASKGIRSAGK